MGVVKWAEPAERDLAIAAYAAGVPVWVIAECLGRTDATVTRWWKSTGEPVTHRRRHKGQALRRSTTAAQVLQQMGLTL